MTARNRLGQFAPRKRKAASKRTRNPSSLPGAMSDEAVRYHVGGEHLTAGEHYAKSIRHDHAAQRALAHSQHPHDEWAYLADQEERYADAHRAMAHALADLERVTSARKRGFRR